MGYQTLAIKGFSWVGLLRISLRGASLIKTALLARILTPSQFGAFGIVAIILGILEMFTETGINVFLIQDKSSNAITKYLNTAYALSIIRGFMISFLILVSIPLVIGFFRDDSAIPLLIVSALVPLIRGFINPAIVNFQKKLDFGQEFWFRNTTVIADLLVAVLVAIFTYSAQALVLGMVAAALAEVIISRIFVKPTPRWEFNLNYARKIVGSGKWITSAGIFEYIFQKGPDIVIGRLLGTTSLGYYQMAYRFTALPVGELLDALNRVTFPIYVKITGDKSRYFKALRKNYVAVFSMGLPLLGLVYWQAAPIITLALGPDWLVITPYIKTLAILSLVRLFISPLSSVLLSHKKQRTLSLGALIKLVVMLGLIYPLTVKYGVNGSIITLVMALIIVMPFYLFQFIRLYQRTVK